MPKTSKSILIIFCLFLALPTVGQWLDFDFFSRQNENRKWEEPPKFSWTLEDIENFPGKYQAYYNDNFGFRNTLLRANSFIRYRLLGISPSSLVIPGRDGWLYYTGNGEIDDRRGISQFNDEQLSRWAMALSLKKYWLEHQGIRYLLVIPPNKSSIYPEYLPEGYGRVRAKSSLDDFISYMRRHTDLDIVDLRDVLLSQKNQYRLYLRTDTHWNNYGAFIGAKEIVGRLSSYFPLMQPLKADDFVIELEPCPPGDLAGMIGGHGFLSEEDYTFTPKKPYAAVMSEKNVFTWSNQFTMTKDEKSLPRVVVFRDSFFTAMVPFFAENFSVSRFILEGWNEKTAVEEIIKKYQPQIVIEETLERLLKDKQQNVSDYLSKDVIDKIIAKDEKDELPLSEVKATNQAETRVTEKGLVVKSNGDDPQLILPDSSLIAKGNNGLLLVATIESKAETQAQLFYKTMNDPEYSELKSKTVFLNKGINEIKIIVFDRDVNGPLRFDPAKLPGEYTIKKVIVYGINLKKDGQQNVSDHLNEDVDVIDKIIAKDEKEELPLSEVKATYQAETRVTEKGLVVKTNGDDPQLLLPDSSLIAKGNNGLLLVATIESKIETQAQLFYKTMNDPEYSELKSKTVFLNKGINEIKIIVFDRDVNGPLRFDPAKLPGEYTIKKVIVYGVNLNP